MKGIIIAGRMFDKTADLAQKLSENSVSESDVTNILYSYSF